MKLNLLNILLLITGGGLFLTSCNRDDGIDINSSPVAVQFSPKVGKMQTRTTAGGNEWSAGDRIGIYMLKNGEALSDLSIVDDANNKDYWAETSNNATSSFMPVNGKHIFYPQNGDKVDFIAYYPYKSYREINDYIYPVDISRQNVPADIDVLYSNDAIAKDKKSGIIDLKFEHVLSKVSFTLIAGDGGPNLMGAKVEITNLATQAQLDLKNGMVTATNSGQTVIANTAFHGLRSSAIVIPQPLSATKLIITLSGNVSKFEWTFTTSQFEKGRNHGYEITISKTGITVSQENIIPWTGVNDPPTTSTTEKGYKVGDYYPDPTAIYENGRLKSGTAAIGVVFWLDNQVNGDYPYDKVSEHGKMVGLYEREAAPIDDKWPIEYGTIYNAGTDWELPTLGDHNYIYCAFNGISYDTWKLYESPSDPTINADKRIWFNTKITNAGGNITDGWHWTSNEYNVGFYHIFSFSRGEYMSPTGRMTSKYGLLKHFRK